MKRIILFLAVCVLSLVSYAQGIVSDQTQSDGTRNIICHIVDVNDPTDDVKLGVSVGANVMRGTTYYMLIVNQRNKSPFTIDEGMKLLLKDMNGDVTTLEVMEVVDVSYNNDDYFSQTPIYSITESQLNNLSKGVMKIRQEFYGGFYDKEFKNDKIGWVISKEYAQIKEALKTSKNIYSDF